MPEMCCSARPRTWGGSQPLARRSVKASSQRRRPARSAYRQTSNALRLHRLAVRDTGPRSGLLRTQGEMRAQIRQEPAKTDEKREVGGEILGQKQGRVERHQILPNAKLFPCRVDHRFLWSARREVRRRIPD